MPVDDGSFDLVVIGGGPGGYTAALRAAQLGKRVACVEKDSTLGGTCLNIGCIPSKALLDSTELFHQIQAGASAHGIRVDGAAMDVDVMMDRKEKVVQGFTRGIEHLFRKSGVEWIRGAGRFIATDRIEAAGGDGGSREVTADTIIIATGSTAAALPGSPFDEKRILSSTGALALRRVPEHLIVIGGGVIGLELGSVWLRLGARVTVLEMAPTILPGLDADLSSGARAILGKQGFDFRTGVRVAGVEKGDSGVRVAIEGADPIEGEHVLVAIGRRPNTAGLDAEKLGIRFDRRGAVVVDRSFHTGVGKIYAVGDAIGGFMLAHEAMEEGMAAAAIAGGGIGVVDYDAIARVVYTWPEVASVGLSEEEARERGGNVLVGKFPFSASGRARAMNETEGFVKVVADAGSRRLLGVHILGARASDLISEASLAIAFQASVDDLALTVHAHPTLPEAIKEAALVAMGRAINL
ncbi:MAG TPA: dihydrolipoyl dehydrogenase [Armatimonadota bacterium]|nr:dihydrolipoyl dehydrogenase [Armatimonadota bacterium]